MTHPRKTIREAAKTILVNASIVGSKVFTNRDIPMDAVADLPAIVIYTLPEQSHPRDQTSTILTRKLDVGIKLYAKAQVDDDIDDTVDAFSALIEAALSADITWGGAATDTVLKSTEWTQDDKGGDASIGVLHLKYQATYFL